MSALVHAAVPAPLQRLVNDESEVAAHGAKALPACPWIERRVAVEHIPEFLTFGYVPTPRTLYQWCSMAMVGIMTYLPDDLHVKMDRMGMR
jgi:hypothetical protein